MNIEIEPAEANDGFAILDMTANSGFFTAEEIKVADELWNAYLSAGASASGYSFLVYRENGKAQGYACYGLRPMTEGTYDLYWLVTAKESKGRGIGSALLHKVEVELRTLGARLLVIETAGSELYEPTCRFYRNYGCELSARIRDFYRPGEDLCIFTRYL